MLYAFCSLYFFIIVKKHHNYRRFLERYLKQICPILIYIGGKMESRKLISFGSSSYVVSLPKNWIHTNKLVKGDSIYIEEKPNELLLTTDSSEKEKEIKEKQIEASNKPLRRIESEIAAAYLTTYDVIEIRNINEGDMPKIKEILQYFAGLEILEQTSTKIVARDLINVNEVSIKTLIRRIDIILRSILDDAVACLNDMKKVKSAQFDERDNELNRLTYLVTRIAIAALRDPKLAKKFNTNPVEIMTEQDLATRLERIGDHLKRLARHIEKVKEEKQFGEICEILRIVREKYMVMMKSYYSRDVQAAFEIETTAKAVFERCDALFSNGINKNIFHAITHLKNMFTSIRYAARTIIINNS